MQFKTNAENLDELDIALAELYAFSPYRPSYQRAGFCHTEDVDPHQAGSRLAMFDDIDGGTPLTQLYTAWSQMRVGRYDPRFDHSTHNLWPFVGKLEPRLARALINIAIGPQADATIVDPFCGSGTVLLEANLMGLEAVGNDLDPFAVWLSQTKLTVDALEFERRKSMLWEGVLDRCPPLTEQRAACPPTRARTVVSIGDAVNFLDVWSGKANAIVTSPPYYDAIDYNGRHHIERKRLGLSAPNGATMGIGQSLAEYEANISAVASRVAACLKPGGKAVLVTANYRSVDVTKLYEEALKNAGLDLDDRLKRSYRSPVLDVKQDDITVWSKPRG